MSGRSRATFTPVFDTINTYPRPEALTLDKALSVFSTLLITLGLALMALNLVGQVHYRTLTPGSTNVLENAPRPLTEAGFWAASRPQPEESQAAYARRLNLLVNHWMLQAGATASIPDFTENWLAHLVGTLRGRWIWFEAEKTGERGAGESVHHALLLAGILKHNGIANRYIERNGLVYVKIDTKEGPRYFLPWDASESDASIEASPAKDLIIANTLGELRPRDELIQRWVSSLAWVLPALLVMLGAWVRHPRGKNEHPA